MSTEWSNWSGSLKFTPGRTEFPDSEDALVRLVSEAAAEGKKIRPVAAGHSSTPIMETKDILVSTRNLTDVLDYDTEGCEATIGSGMSLHDAETTFLSEGLAMPNLGDVDVQTVVGAISGATHGTGKRLQNLSSLLIGGRLVTAAGEVKQFSLEDDPEFTRAAQVSLGTLGIFTALRLRLAPAFRLHRQEWCAYTKDCLEHLNELIEGNRNFDFYWYPRSDVVKLRTLNLPGEDMEIPFARRVIDMIGWSNEVLPKERTLKFDEMEYFIPAQYGPECFQEIRDRIKEKHRKTVGWRVFYRTIAPDDAFLSTAHGRETVSIAILQNNTLPYWDYFKDIEQIFRKYEGRPHWAKKHTLTARELRPLYPRWDDFLKIRKDLDPDGMFLNDYLRELLGVEPT